MSFLSGIVSFGKKALGFLGGNSIASTLARTALLGYAVNKLSQSALKGNELGNQTNNIDKGVRLQIKPDAEAKIPVLYGSAYFGGNITDAAMTNANKTMWYCLVLSEKTGSKYSDSSATGYTFEDVYWNQQRIVFQADGVTADYTVDRSGTIDRSVSGLVKVYLYAGSSSDGQVPAGYTGAVPNADTLFPNWGPSTHPMNDLVFALVRVDYSREKNVTGIGDMLFHVESDMRKPGDVLYDYMTNSVYGAGIATAEIKTADITALNTYSAQSVSYSDQATGPATLANRYQINGLLDTANNVLDNAEKVTSAAGSYLSYDTHEGQWGVVINKAETSSASFSDDNILGNIAVGGTGLQDLYNGVKVGFPHRDLRDSADFVKIEVPSGDRNANEPNNTLNITYDVINEPVQAEVLGFIELKQSRVDLIIQFETDFSYINLKAGDVIDVTNDRYGFTNKLFRIITITERQDQDGSLSMSVTALEYDSDVYSTQNITRYTRSDDDGIITIGSIGIPGTPQVTKFEKSNRPRIEIETTAPTGVVEGIEFWISFDFQEANDDLRSYTLIGTKRPVGGGVYTSGTDVTFEYSNLNAQDFYVKVRGVNTTTTGPYSNVSGLVEFVPEQIPDAITPDTSILDSTGGLATALGIVTLLNNLDGLFGGDGSTGLFDKIFQTFEDVTGFDIVGETTDGNYTVPTNLRIQEEGTDVATSVASINFTGDAITASANGSAVTIDVTGGAGTLPDGENDKDILAWNAEAGEWQIIPDCIDCDFPVDPEVIPDVACSLVVASSLPGNIGTNTNTICKSDNDVPYEGSYFIKFDIEPGSTAGSPNSDIPLYAPLQPGIGNVELYGSDGTLEQSLAESQVIIRGNVLELPFAPRMPGKDYYILMPEGFVTSCSCENREIDFPDPDPENPGQFLPFNGYTWAFRTSIDEAPSYNSLGGADLLNTPDLLATGTDLRIISFTPKGRNQCPTNSFEIIFNQEVQKNSGSVVFTDRLSGVTARSLTVASAVLSDHIEIDPVTQEEILINPNAVLTWTGVSLSPGTAYNINVPEGLVITKRVDETVTVCDVSYTILAEDNEPNPEYNYGIETQPALDFVRLDYCEAVSGNSTLIGNLRLLFNKGVFPASESGCFVYIYESGGGLHQKIDINATFDNGGYNDVYRFSGSSLYLNPTKPFSPGKDYYVSIPSATIKDGCDEVFGGTTTDTFSTDGIETVIPNAPTYGSTYLDLEFKRPVVPGKGMLNILDSNGKLLTRLKANDTVVQISKEPF